MENTYGKFVLLTQSGTMHAATNGQNRNVEVTGDGGIKEYVGVSEMWVFKSSNT
jgi:hypothetical protein